MTQYHCYIATIGFNEKYIARFEKYFGTVPTVVKTDETYTYYTFEGPDRESLDGNQKFVMGSEYTPESEAAVAIAEVPQVVVSDEEPKPTDIQFNYEVRNDGLQYVKPKGGFWTSSLDAGSSEWLRWCEREMPAWTQGARWLLTPRADARVYTISTISDLERLVLLYPEIFEVGKVSCIDYGRMQQEWDALHLTKEGEHAIRAYGKCALNNPLYREEWSCESTVWFRWCFEKVEKF